MLRKNVKELQVLFRKLMRSGSTTTSVLRLRVCALNQIVTMHMPRLRVYLLGRKTALQRECVKVGSRSLEQPWGKETNGIFYV